MLSDNVRRILFLLLGLTCVYSPKGRKQSKETTEKLLEPDGSRVCRRNILALAGVVVVAGLVGADPRDLIVFGVKPSGDCGVLVIGAAIILIHVYWYVLRYHHLNEDGVIDQDPAISATDVKYLKISWNRSIPLVRREADLFSNWAAFVLTLASWLVVASWIFDWPSL